MEALRRFLEYNGFEVCTRTGEKMGISVNVVRRYFIYLSFFTFGSPVLIYIIAAFWLQIKDHLRSRRFSALDF